MKAVAYARYSSDLQKPSSIGDQQALCRKYCARSGYTIIAEYADAAQSGSDTRDRLGYQALMNDAKTGAFDAVIVEAFDRLSRDLGSNAGRDVALARELMATLCRSKRQPST